MAEEIGFETGRKSNFQGLVTLTLTLDPAVRHTVVHQSSTSTYIPNSFKSKKLFVDGRTDGRTDGLRTFFPPLILLGRLLEVDLKIIITIGMAWSCRRFALSECFKFVNSSTALSSLSQNNDQWKNAQRCKHCALAVVRRSQKVSSRYRPPSRGYRTTKI